LFFSCRCSPRFDSHNSNPLLMAKGLPHLGMATLGLVLAVMAMVASAKTYTASFNVKGFVSTATFEPVNNAQMSVTISTSAASSDVPVGTPVRWTIHEFSVSESGTSSDLCSTDVVGGAWDPTGAESSARGYLIGHTGPLALDSKTSTLNLGNINDNMGIAGRALVLHLDSEDNTPLFCANIGTDFVTAVSTNFTAIPAEDLTFLVSPRITQLRESTTSVMQFTVATSASPTTQPKYTFKILSGPCPTSGSSAYPEAMWSMVDGLSFIEGIARGQHELTDATNFFGRSIVLSLTAFPGEVLQCQDLVPPTYIVAPARNYQAPVYVTSFSSSYVSGKFTFQQVSKDEVLISTVMTDFSTDIKNMGALWHIHEFAASDNQQACDAGVTGGHWDPTFLGMADPKEAGNLSGRHGVLTLGERVFSEKVLPAVDELTGPRGIVGRSIVIHLKNPAQGNPRLVCKTIGTTPAVGLQSAAFTPITQDGFDVTLPVPPRFVELPSAAGDPATAYLQFSVKNAGASAATLRLVLNNGKCSEQWTAADALITLDDFTLEPTTGTFTMIRKVPSATYFYGRSVSIVAPGTGDQPTHLQCQNINPTSGVTEPIRDYSSPVITASIVSDEIKATFLFQRVSAAETLVGTAVTELSEALKTAGALWHVHEFAAGSDPNACGAEVTGGHWDPTFLGMTDPNEVGNLSGRHGVLALDVRYFSDSKLGDIFGQRGIAGRSIVVHRRDIDMGHPRIACGTIGDEKSYRFAATYTAPGLDAVVTFTMAPRIVQLPDTQGAYVQFAGKASTDPVPASLVVLDGDCPPSTLPDQVPRVLHTLTNTVTGNVIASIPDGTLYHDRNVAIIRNSDKKSVFCERLTLSDTSFAPEESRDTADVSFSAVFDAAGSTFSGAFTLQQVGTNEVIIINSLAATGQAALQWAIHEVPLYTLPAGVTSSLDATVCATAGPVWNPTAAAAPIDPVGALSKRYGPVTPGVPRAFSDVSNLVNRRNYDGFTLVVSTPAGVVLGCARIGAPAVVGIATLPTGNGRLVVRQTVPGLTQNPVLRTVFYSGVTPTDVGDATLSGYFHQFGAAGNSCSGLGPALEVTELFSVSPPATSVTPVSTSFDFKLLIGRSFAITNTSDASKPLVACALIVNADPSATTTALTPATLRTAHATLLPNAGQTGVPAITIQVEQPIGVSSSATRFFVKVDATALTGDAAELPWHAHVFPAPAAGDAEGFNNCAATLGHMDTSFHGSAGEMESGDIAARVGRLPVAPGKTGYFVFEDTVSTLSPDADSIIGRAITVHRSATDSTRIACGNVLPVGTITLPGNARTSVTEVFDGTLKLRLLINDHKLPGYRASLVFDGSVANPNLSTSADVSLAFHTYFISHVGTDKNACSLSKSGPVFVPAGEKRSGDLVKLAGLAPITLPARSDASVRVNYAGPVNADFTFNLSEYAGRSVVLRSSYGADVCSNIEGEGTVMDSNPADKLVHHIRVAVLQKNVAGAAAVTFIPADAVNRVISLFNNRFADAFDNFYAAGQSVWSNEPWSELGLDSVSVLAQGDYGVTLVVAGVPKDQNVSASSAAAADVVAAITHPEAISQFHSAIGGTYTLKSVQQGPVATLSGSCSNGFKDNGETDPDCGNSAVTTCAPCSVDKACTVDSDCASHRCSTSTHKCLKGGNSAATVSVSFGALLIALVATIFV
jgi:hypothetical protein